MNTRKRYLLSILCILLMMSYSNLTAQLLTWEQTTWHGGSGQFNYADTSKYYKGGLAIIDTISGELRIRVLRRRPVSINNQAQDTLIDYQLRIKVTYDTLMDSGFRDLRFTDKDKITLLHFWVEDTFYGDSAIYWVRVPEVLPNTVDTIYMYYGDGDTTWVQNSNPDSVFELYDNFDDGIWDDKWFRVQGDKTRIDDRGDTIEFGCTYGNKCAQLCSDNEVLIRNRFGYCITYKASRDQGVIRALCWGVYLFGDPDLTSYDPWDLKNAYRIFAGPDLLGTNATTGDEGIRVYATEDSLAPTFVAETLFTGTNWDVWHDYKVIYYQDSFWIYMDGNFYLKFRDTTKASKYFALGMFNNPGQGWSTDDAIYGALFDELRVRKYVKPEPQITIGSPELASGVLISSAYFTGDDAAWDSVLWNDSLPPGTEIRFKLRTSYFSDMYGALDWDQCTTITNPCDISILNSVHDSDRYIQYWVELISNNSDSIPILYDIEVRYEWLRRPTVFTDSIRGESGTLPVYYRVHNPDTTQNVMTAEWEFRKLDSLIWNTVDAAQISNNYWKPPTPTGETDTIFWNSKGGSNNLDGYDGYAEFRMKALNDGGFWSDYCPPCTFYVDNNDTPGGTLDTIIESYDSVRVGYLLQDAENDTLGIFFEYLLPGSTTWHRATIHGDTINLGQSHYDSCVYWLANIDLPDSIDYYPVYIRMYVYDSVFSCDTSAPIVSCAFRVDFDSVPTCSLWRDTIPDTVKGNQWVYATLKDRESDSLRVRLKYQVDGTGPWLDASVIAGDTGWLVGYTDDTVVQLLWASAMDLPNFKDTVQLMLIPYDHDSGVGDTSYSFLVINTGLPFVDSIWLDSPDSEYTHDVKINYVLNDSDYDTLAISCYYSTDDGTTYTQTFAITGDTVDIDSSKYDTFLYWRSYEDLRGFDGDVLFKIVPRDKLGSGGWDTVRIHLDNNYPPWITDLVGPLSEQYDTVRFEFVVHDSIYYLTGDTLIDTVVLRCYYSTDGGSSWNLTNNIIFHKGSDTIVADDTLGDSIIIVWQSRSDVGSIDLIGMQFRVLPFDNDTGQGFVDTFHLDNNLPPAVTSIDTPVGEQSDTVVIAYTLKDTEWDTLSIICEYYDGVGWHNATVLGNTSNLDSPYIDTIKWLSYSDLPDTDLMVQFRITPQDSDLGIPGVTGQFHLDNFHRQSVTIQPITDEQSDTVTIIYNLYDSISNDTLDLTVFYSTDNSVWLTPTLVVGDTVNIPPSGYLNRQLDWLTRNDLPGYDDTVWFRIIPKDDWASGIEDTISFWLDNNLPPIGVSIDTPQGEVSDSIMFHYSFADSEWDTLTLLFQYLIINTSTWQTAAIIGTSVIDSPYIDSVIWLSDSDLALMDTTVKFRVVPLDKDTGTPVTTGWFKVDNYHNHEAVIDSPAALSEHTGDLMVYYHLVDITYDVLGVICEYSLDSSTWQPAWIYDDAGVWQDDTSDISKPEYVGVARYAHWCTDSNIAGNDTIVWFRITPYDNFKPGIPAIRKFRIDNNEPPKGVSINTPPESKDTIQFVYTLQDTEHDTLHIECYYKVEGGVWDTATLTSNSELDTIVFPYQDTVWWVSNIDLPNIDTICYFKVVPFDQERGDSVMTGAFRVDNYHSQKCSIWVEGGEQSGDVTIYYEITDQTHDTIRLTCLYSLDGVSFSQATVSSDTIVGEGVYIDNIIWYSRNDTDGYDGTVWFTVMPRDQPWWLTGIADTISFQLDNNFSPFVDTIVPIAPTESKDTIMFAYTLSDSENDTLRIECYYKLGGTWYSATVFGDTGNLIAPYNDTVYWVTNVDLPDTDVWVYFKIVPFDNDRGDSVMTVLFHVDNYHSQEVTSLANIGSSGDITIDYILNDPTHDTLKITCLYKQEGGIWQHATTSGDTIDIIWPGGYDSSVIWYSDSDLAGIDDTVWFKIIPKDKPWWIEGIADSIRFHVDNNVPPYGDTIVPIAPGEVKDTVKFLYRFDDNEGDTLYIKCYYKKVGKTWQIATIFGDTDSIVPGNMDSVYWVTNTDLDTIDTVVVFKIVPFDNDRGDSIMTQSFRVDNYHNQKVDITPLVGEQTGDINIGYDLQDRTYDVLRITCLYSQDNSTWLHATTSSDTDSIDYTQYKNRTVSWYSRQDLFGYADTVWFRIVPRDEPWGISGREDTIKFYLDNNLVPEGTSITTPTEDTGRIQFVFALKDTEWDTLFITCEYRTEISVWRKATIIETIGGPVVDTIYGIDSPYVDTVYWLTDTDLSGCDSLVYFRVIPYDEAYPQDRDKGVPISTGVFRVDNYHNQSVSITPIVEEQTGDVAIKYQLTDPTGDTLYIECFYSLDGNTWNAPYLDTGRSKLDTITPPYQDSVIWLTRRNLNYQDTTVYFRIIVYDNWNIAGGEDTIAFHLDNNYPPFVVIDSLGTTPVAGEQSDSVFVYFTVGDTESDSIQGYTCEYSFDGLLFYPATCSISGLSLIHI